MGTISGRERQSMTTLIRLPSRRYQRARPEYRATMNRYDYVTPDRRWYVETYPGCGGGWSVTDTTGKYVCGSCRDNHTTVVRTLTAAKAFISEWNA
jgi:hypothetical protein